MLKETKDLGIYVHVPFCANKCLYCDFYTGGSRIADWSLYTKCLINELVDREKEFVYDPTTLYFGGGTPSLIPIDELRFLILEIKKIIDFDKLKEFTIEVNPEDVSEQAAQVWHDLGVNRISMGVQSFIDEELRTIGRHHDSIMAVEAFEKIKKHFDNISLDIMFGLPGQTVSTYKQTLNILAKLGPSHISSYSLMLEKGTAMTFLVNNNDLTLPSEEEWLEMYELSNDFFKEQGYIRYEISNYSKAGFESVHNTNYWLGKPYIGLGPGAHSYDGGKIRRANPNDIKGWLKFFSEYKTPVYHNQLWRENSIFGSTSLNEKRHLSEFYREEHLTEEELREEFIMTRLRMTKGLNINKYKQEFGEKEGNLFLNKAKKFINGNLLYKKGNYIAFTPSGFFLSDDILSSLI